MEDVKGTAVQAKIVDAAIHVSPLVCEFIRKHSAFELSAEVGSLESAEALSAGSSPDVS